VKAAHKARRTSEERPGGIVNSFLEKKKEAINRPRFDLREEESSDVYGAVVAVH
jgi:hypothetical protein